MKTGNKAARKQNQKLDNTRQKKEVISKRKNLSLFAPLLLAFCLPVLLYWQTIYFGFSHFDDHTILSDNIAFLSDFGNAGHAFLTNAFIKPPGQLYRPLQTFSYMLDIQLSGGNYPWMHHLTNIFLLGFIGCALFLLLNKLFKQEKLSLLLAMAFCVHPLFVSTVAWIPARGELLLILFSLLSFIFLADFLQKNNIASLAFHFIAFILALFCKETAAFLPLLYILYYFSHHYDGRIDKKYILNPVIYVAAVIFWYWMRCQAVHQYFVDLAESPFHVISSNLRVIPESLAQFFIPYGLAPISSFSAVKTTIGLAVILLFIYLFIRNRKISKRTQLFGVAWFIILIIPPMFYKDPNYDYLNHRFFLPLIGMLLSIQILAPKKPVENNEKKVCMLLIVLLALLGSITFIHTRSYSDPMSYYNSAISLNPGSAFARHNRGSEYYGLKQFDKALEDYSKAIELNPRYDSALINRGKTLYNVNQLSKALEDCNAVIRRNPKYFNAYMTRGLIFQRLQQYNSALSDYDKAIAMSPNFIEAYINRGLSYSSLKLYSRAAADYSMALELDPKLVIAYYYRGMAYDDLRQYDQAMSDYDMAIALEPQNSQAYCNRGLLLLKKNDINGAISDFKQAIALNKNLEIAYSNLGGAYFNLGKYDEAIDYFSKSITLSGSKSESYMFRGVSYFNIHRTDLACKDWMQAKKLGSSNVDQYIAGYCRQRGH